MSSGAEAKKKDESGGLGETLRVVVHAIILAMIVRTFLYQPFNIPSGSMMPTLLVGDYLFVSKFSYGYSKHSFWGLDLFDGRILFSEPERGDVVVFKYPTDNSTDYIKRLVGLPGDRIQIKDGVLHINGEAVKRRKLEEFVDADGPGEPRRMARYEETLPNGVVYLTLDERASSSDNSPVFTVPEGKYFMMGDNRDNSQDSRFPDVGFVAKENLVGRADVIFFSICEYPVPGARAATAWCSPIDIRWSRFFDLIR